MPHFNTIYYIHTYTYTVIHTYIIYIYIYGKTWGKLLDYFLQSNKLSTLVNVCLASLLVTLAKLQMSRTPSASPNKAPGSKKLQKSFF